MFAVRFKSGEVPAPTYRHYIYAIFVISLMFTRVSGGHKRVNYAATEMTHSEIISYFQSLLQNKFSSRDLLNEEAYMSENNAAEDLFFSIDNLMPRPLFMRYLMKTKNITDKRDGHGVSLLPQYPGTLNAPCNPKSVFNHSARGIIRKWDGDKAMVYNDIEYWFKENQWTPHTGICNRFRGLSCQPAVAVNPEVDNGMTKIPSDNTTCQCSGDGANVGYYKSRYNLNHRSHSRAKYEYPDGCYIRPWRPCRHMSLDYAFRSLYRKWHSSLDNRRAQLAQLIFPVARTHRCKEGTFCLDMIPGINKPVCWCGHESSDPICVKNENQRDSNKKLPTGPDFATLRRLFLNLIIPANETFAHCNPALNWLAEKIDDATGKDPTATGAIQLMRGLVQNFSEAAFVQGNKFKICDFRENLFCDKERRVCRGKGDCGGPGKINMGQGVCAVNNGFPCQSNEDCVERAKCTLIKGTTETYCVCESGYGDRCSLEKAPYFAKFFIPLSSGFVGDKFIKLQESISTMLETWEDAMRRKQNEACDTGADKLSMEIVDFFSKLDRGIYREDMGEKITNSITSITNDGRRLCSYTKFLRCDPDIKRCVPIVGSRILPGPPSHLTSQRDEKPLPEKDNKIYVEILADEDCGKTKIPRIYHDIVVPVCVPGYACVLQTGLYRCKPACESPLAPRKFCPIIDKGFKSVIGERTEAPSVEEEEEPELTSPPPLISREDPVVAEPPEPVTEPPEPVTEPPKPPPTVKPEPSSPPPPPPSPTTSSEKPPTSSSSSTTPAPQPPPPPPPSSKGTYGMSCTLDSETGASSCDESLYLTCVNEKCACWRKLHFSRLERKCVIPIATRCLNEELRIPESFLANGMPDCEFKTACLEEAKGLSVCRPRSDDMLILMKHKS